MKVGEMRPVYRITGRLAALESEMQAIRSCAKAMGCLMVLARRQDGADGWQVFVYRPPKPKPGR